MNEAERMRKIYTDIQDNEKKNAELAKQAQNDAVWFRLGELRKKSEAIYEIDLKPKIEIAARSSNVLRIDIVKYDVGDSKCYLTQAQGIDFILCEDALSISKICAEILGSKGFIVQNDTLVGDPDEFGNQGILHYLVVKW